MRTKSLSSAEMEARVARFNQLQTYQRQNFETHGIPPGAVEKITARRVYPVMAPPDYQGRSAGAPVKGPRGLIVSIAECEPGNGPGLHRHRNTVESFFCLSGRFEIGGCRPPARPGRSDQTAYVSPAAAEGRGECRPWPHDRNWHDGDLA